METTSFCCCKIREIMCVELLAHHWAPTEHPVNHVVILSSFFIILITNLEN